MYYLTGQGIRGDLGTTSSANQQLLPIINSQWSSPRGKYYEFSFLNTEACTVIINGKDTNVLAANQGIQTVRGDVVIESIVVVQPNINFNWSGKYGS